MNPTTTMIQADTDLDLLQRFRHSRDRDAFSEIVLRYGPVVFGVCHRVLGDFQSAEDAFQQTFMNLARSAHLIRKPEALPGWLYSTARRSAIAKIEPHERKSALPREIEDQQRDPLNEITGRELVRTIEEELSNLPEDYRSAILLCGIDGVSVDEAAERLGSTNGSVRGWLQRGRELLKTRLARRGFEIPAALAVIFGVPSPVPAATTTAAVNAAMASTSIKPIIGAQLLSIVSSKYFSIFFITIIVGFAGWKFYKSIPRPELPPLNVAKWELSTDTPLPKGAIARIGDGRHTLELGKRLIHFANEDKTLIAVGETEFLAWDVITGKQLHRTAVENIPCDISPDGKWLAQAGKVYEADTGKLHWQAFEDRKPNTVQFVGNNLVAMVFHKSKTREVEVRLLNANTKAIQTEKFIGFRAKLLPGGERVAVWDRPEDDYEGILAADETERDIRIHTMKEPNGKPVTLAGFKGEPIAVDTNALGTRLFAATPDKQLSCWDTGSGELLYRGEIPIPPPNTTRGLGNGNQLKYFSREDLNLMHVAPKGDKVLWNGWEVSGTLDLTCHSIANQKVLWKCKPNIHTANARFHFDELNNRILMNDHRIEVIDAESGVVLSPANSQYMGRGPSFISHAMAVSRDGRLVAFCNRTIGLYDVEKILDANAKLTSTPETIWQGTSGRNCGFLPGSNNLVWTSNSNLSVRDIDLDRTLATTDYFLSETSIQHNSATPKWVYFDQWNLRWGTIEWDGKAFQKTEQALPKAMKDTIGFHYNLGYWQAYGDRLYVATIEEGKAPTTTLTCWNPSTVEKQWEFSFPGMPEYEVTNTTTIDGKNYFPEYKPKKIVFSPDGSKVVVLNNTNLVMLNATTGVEIKNLTSQWAKNNQIEFDNVEFTPDGTHLVIGVLTNRMDKQEIQQRPINDLDKVVRKIDLGRPGVYTNGSFNVRFAQNGDGKLIAVRQGDQGLKIFEWTTGAVKYHLPQVPNGYGASFSADNQRLLAMERNQNTSIVWNLSAFAVK